MAAGSRSTLPTIAAPVVVVAAAEVCSSMHHLCLLSLTANVPGYSGGGGGYNSGGGYGGGGGGYGGYNQGGYQRASCDPVREPRSYHTLQNPTRRVDTRVAGEGEDTAAADTKVSYFPSKPFPTLMNGPARSDAFHR